MRYRKSIKIAKGVRVNLSKSGASLSVGGRGASVSMGSRGTYLNTGIPGTGLYSRQKIGGGPRSTSTKKSSGSQQVRYVDGSGTALPAGATQYDLSGGIKVEYDSEGQITLKDGNGRIITDPGTLRYIKKTPQYAAEVERLSRQREEQLEQETNAFVEIYKESCKVYPVQSYIAYTEAMEPEQYTRKEFTVPQPSRQEIEEELREEGNNSISTIKVWQKKKLVEEFVQTNIRTRLTQQMLEWKEAKDKFDLNEEAVEKEKNKEYMQKYMKEKAYFDKLLQNDEKTVDQALQSWITSVTFPFEFNIDYALKDSTLYVDLDLPEIEDIPLHYAQRMANGTVKVKNKTQKAIKEDYYKCVIGMAICFASHLFKCAIGVENIVLSAYTQRRDTKGLVNDDYIYSVKFERSKMAKMDLKESLENSFFSFENICVVKADKSFKTIAPFEVE